MSPTDTTKKETKVPLLKDIELLELQDPKVIVGREEEDFVAMREAAGRVKLKPIGVWAALLCVNLVHADRCGDESEKNFFQDRREAAQRYQILLLTNNMIKIRSRRKPDNHMYVPLQNVKSFQMKKDRAFEKRIADASAKSAEGT